MAETISWKDKTVMVVGMGRSGQAAVKVLHKKGASVIACDGKQATAADAKLIRDLEKKGIPVYFGGQPPLDGVDLLVLSPGVPLVNPLVEEAQEKGIPVTGELELAYLVAKEGATFLAITGTNGKTTTTTLVGEIVKAAGLPCEVVGNIGIAAVEKTAKAKKGTWFVVEVSSFQLETIETFKPKVAALLNITPDHLDRHKTLENYAATKARIFENQDEGDFAVVNFDDKPSLQMSTSTGAKVVPFSRLADMKFGACVREGKIVVIDGEEKVHPICDAKDLKIPGDHNLENALAAVAVTFFAGIEPKYIRKVLKSFKGVEHRIEDLGTVKGVRYYNDSKGTNPDAAMKAIQAMAGDTIIIAGGYDKGADFTEFIKAFEGKVYYAVLIGKTAVKIKETAESLGFTDTIIVEDMAAAVREAARKAKKGDSVLLSPACASWDMYNSFEERGDDFRSCVEALKTKK